MPSGVPGGSASGPGPSRETTAPGKKDARFVRRAVSPGPLADGRRISATSGPLAAASNLTALTTSRVGLVVAADTKASVGVRARDKFVPLPDASRQSQVVPEEEDDEPATESEPPSAVTVAQKRGRITVIAVAESFNRKALEGALQLVAAGQPSTSAPLAATRPVTSGSSTPGTSVPAAAFSEGLLAGPIGDGASATSAANGAASPSTTIPGALPSVAAVVPPTLLAPVPNTSGPVVGSSGSGGRGGATAVTMAVTAYPEVTYVRTAHGEAMDAPGEVFFFDYGVVAFWGMTEAQEQLLLESVVKLHPGVAVQPLDEDEKQMEELLFVYSRDSPPNIRNDTFTIDSRLAADHQVKMAISHALAQSSKLAVYEERMVGLVEEVRHIPGEMAERGAISMSRRKVAQLMGKVFLLKAAVNLTATMLDTPEFFWRAPDQLQGLYERACEYLELEARLDMLNTRFLVLQRMLSIWSDHSAHQNLARLDVFIVLLILIEVVMAGMEVVGFLLRRRGWEWHGPRLGQLLLGALGRSSGWGPQPGQLPAGAEL